RRSPALAPLARGLVERGSSSRPATGFFVRPGFPHCSRQYPGRTAGKALHLPTEPQPARHSDLLGPRCQPPCPLLRPCRYTQGRSSRRGFAVCRALAAADTKESCCVCVRLALSHLRQSRLFHPPAHPLLPSPQPIPT